jgi:hypothetical protein
MVEHLEIRGINLARALRTDIDPPLQSRMPCPRVWRMIDMVGVSAGRIDVKIFLQTLQNYQMTENAFGGRRPANISHTNEENANLFHTV